MTTTKQTVRSRLPLLLAVVCVPLLLTCTDYRNPFTDTANARAVFLGPPESDIADRDSVLMFTSYRVAVAVLVSEQVDSFQIRADSSYQCGDSIVAAPGTENYVFTVAFADTGAKRICLTTFRDGGDVAVDEMILQVGSPLAQEDIAAGIGDELVLSTERVGDSVQYHWSFGDDSVYARDTLTSGVWEVRTRLLAVGTLPGRLWVSITGREQLFTSPAVSFRVVLDDNTGPQIVCLNDSRDTMVTGTERFVFLVNVYDGGGVEQVTVNGAPPVEYWPDYYRTELEGLDTAALTSKPLVVAARDNSGNLSSRTFYIRYDSLAANLQRTQVFIKSAPGGTTTGRDQFRLIGGVREYLRPAVYVTAVVNGAASGDTIEVAMPDKVIETEFSVLVGLELGTNDVVLQALDSNGVLLADTSATIFYSADYEDTRPPTLMSATVSGKLAEAGQKVYVADTLPVVQVRAYDESGIASVTVNGQACPLAPGSAFEWRAAVGPVAYGTPLQVAVVLIDSAGQVLSHQFLVQRNLQPAMPPGWVWPWRLFAGSPLEMRFSVQDEEDRVGVSLENAPAGMSVTRLDGRNEWVVRWTPSETDVGSYSTRVVLDDSLETVTLLWPYKVLRDSTLLVRFLTLPSAFPRFLEANRDTLDVLLAVEPGKGTAPFTFEAQLADRGQLLLNMVDSTGTAQLQWAPAAADTGVRHLAVLVTDDVGDQDWIDRDIEVVRPNADSCRLAWQRPAGVDTTAYGELDMRTASGLVALRFVIEDSDHPYTERYVRTVAQRGLLTVDTLDSAMAFTVTLDTSYAPPHDTVVVTVADRTGGRDTVRVAVLYRYAMPRFAADWEWPVRFVGGTTYALGTAIVSPYHQAQVVLANGPTGMAFTPLAMVNTWMLSYTAIAADSGRYAATVTLSDPYLDTVITWPFVVLADSSRMCAFADSTAMILPYVTAGREVQWPLAVRPGSGTPPLRYTVTCPSTGAVIIDTVTGDRSGITVSWVPPESSMGRRLLVMTVCDSLGDCDTVMREVEVLPVNRWPCSLLMSRSVGTDTMTDGAINMSFTSEPCSLHFTIQDQDHPLTERYTAYITRGAVTTIETLDTSRAFDVIIEPSAQHWGVDTITVVVLDATGTSGMKVVRVWYGIPLPSVSGGARLEVHMAADPGQMALINQNDTLFVNSWTGEPALLPFAANTYSGVPPVLDTVQDPPSLQFDRSEGSNLVSQMSNGVWAWIDSSFTIFVVARADQVSVSGSNCLLATSDTDAGYIGLGVTNGYAGIFSSSGRSESTIAIQAGQWHIYTFSSTAGMVGTTLTTGVWVDGASGNQCTVSDGTLTGYHTMLGATLRSAVNNGWDGSIAEVLMYRGRLADMDRRQVEAYLSSRYGIAMQ